MAPVALLLAAAIVAAGLLGLASPRALTAFAAHWRSVHAFWLVALVRLGGGIVLWQAAPTSRLPLLIQGLALLLVVSAAALAVAGHARHRAWVDWFTSRSARPVRLIAGIAAALGAALLWLLLPTGGG